MGKHFLIAAATSAYPNLPPHDARPQLVGVLAAVVDLFTATLGGYERALETIAENPPADVLRKSLDRWFAAPERDPSDWIVLYYTGHAELVGADSLYLLTTDFEPGQYAGTAFSLRQLADIVLARRGDGGRRGVRNLLVIVDTCFAGEGVRDLVSQLSSVFRSSSEGSFYLLGAALPRQEAQAGALARALADSIAELSRRYVQQEWLYLEQIVPAINHRLRVHDAVLAVASSAREEPRFFPNPSRLETHGAPVSADAAQLAIADEEFRAHWGPRSRGVEFDNQPGSYFSGRRAVLAKLAAYLGSEGDHRTRVVTGRPGAGKSAILSRVVSAARLGGRAEAGLGGAPADFPVIDLAVHAKGKSLQDVSRVFAERLGVEARPEAIFEHLRLRREPLRIVVDALDEAAEPAAIARQLLQPLNGIESVKLLVGTREEQLDALRGAEVLDIDTPEHADRIDIARYVEARLLRADEVGQPTPYRGKEEIAGRVASAVAEQAYPNFLIARLVVEDLLLRGRVADPDSPADMAFPNRVAGAFDSYLARFGAREPMVRDVLRLLVFARGEGLPWDNVWAPLASAIGAGDYGDDDVRWVLENAGAFVLESAEEGRSVYRLYHQALADALGKGTDVTVAHRSFTEVLSAAAPRRSSHPDWLLASRYARRYLAAHAAACGALGDLVRDPLYLLAADPTRLLTEIAAHGDQVPRDIAAVYAEAVHHLRAEPPASAAAYLELAARQRGLERFAADAAVLPLLRPWRALWARWSPRAPSHSFGKGDNEILALSVATWGEKRPVALVGRYNGAVEIWDVARAERLALWQPAGVGAARHLAFVDEPEPLLVATWEEGHLGVLHLAGDERELRLDEHGTATALCVAELEGRPVCVTAHDSRDLVVRSLPRLETIVAKARATGGKIYDLQPVSERGRAALVSVGDSLVADEDAIDSSRLRLWSLADLSLLWADGLEQRGVLQWVEAGRLRGRMVIVASPNHWNPLQIWDLESRRLLFEGKSASNRAWVYERGDEAFVLDLSFGKLTVRRWGAHEGDDAAGTPIEVHGDRFTGIFGLHARATFLSAVGDHVRVWDLDDLLSQAAKEDRDRGSAAPFATLAVSSSRPDELYAGAGDSVLAFAAGSGEILWQRSGLSPVERRSVKSLAAAPWRDWLIAATADDSIHVLDLAAGGAPLRAIPIDGMPARVRAAQWQGRTLALATVQGRRGRWALRIWDLDSGEEVATSFAYQLMAGEEDKRMHGLAVVEGSTSVHLAFASKYAKVMVAEFSGPLLERSAYPRAYKEWMIPGARGEYVESLAAWQGKHYALLAAGTERGLLALWDLQRGEILARREAAHLGEISALAFGERGGRPALVSGGADGMLRFWTLALDKIFCLDVGEAVAALDWVGMGRLAVGTWRGVVLLDLAVAMGSW
jgi:WD40 repeat protein